MKLQSGIHSPSALPPVAVSAWNDLLANAPARSAFLSHAYAQAVDMTWGSTFVCSFQDQDEFAAFLPFQLPGVAARLLRSATPPGDHFADYFGLVARESFRIDPQALLRASRLHSLLFTHLDADQCNFGLEGASPSKGVRIRAVQDFNFIPELFERDKKFAQDTERRKNKLARDHGELRFVIEQADGECLDWLIAQKVAQYQRTGKTKHPFSDARDHAFLKNLAGQHSPLCVPRLTALYCGEKRIAAHFGLQCLDTLSYWFPVYDPAFHNYSPGRLLLWETLANAATLGIRCVDRGEGDTQAKRDFANEEHFYLRGCYRRSSPQACLDALGKSIQWRIEAWQARGKSGSAVTTQG